ncbi:polyhydroxyalkanoate synthase [Pseudochelatococcus lubricantis]|uniref:Polyhydroxyalkanoate synthase n=1 Tax=Pseudochelatococcus lubricantis TaxID=1538102 RepID=A0ABX0V2X0_9HYPH|nr:class I poly(R)-hydroxyalkanoic acid synthase [Pseudochelatococcus lubricantis]NIJ58449.1 polyhydroxyalkanoate synthase [Pseudochelatococcus lubricantis]
MSKQDANAQAEFPLPDFEELSHNMAKLVEETGKATAAYLKPIESGRTPPKGPADISDMVKTLGQLAEQWIANPQKAIEAQMNLANGFIDLWATTFKRLNGEAVAPVAQPLPGDKRFRAEDWQEHPVYDFLKQVYLITSHWADNLVEGAEGLDDATRQKARFYVKQISSALSPTNFLATNPEVLRETIKENGANLVRGMKMLAEDIAAGNGELKIRQTPPGSYKVGVDLATTPGKVVFRNELFELIQYSPTTETVLKRPVLLIPPWINKYYILDLTRDKSFIKWTVDQGATLFCISWVNPAASLADKNFEAYMREGLIAAVDVVLKLTGEDSLAAVGYCVGGTLLAMTQAYLATNGDRRIDSITLLTAQIDFTRAGDLKVFIDENQISALEDRMTTYGYLDGIVMAGAFNALRPNDLIWPYIINVYLKGQTPFPFDLLHWNSDSTRMTKANHSYYLRKFYLENAFARGELNIGGVLLNPKKITVPVYELATREDHIAPAESVFLGAQLLGGPVRFVLSGSGHIAGVVNPPARVKYQYWTSPAPLYGDIKGWLSEAKEHPGSWWPDWLAWLEAQAPERVPARDPAKGPLPVLGDAPGEYVRVTS